MLFMRVLNVCFCVCHSMSAQTAGFACGLFAICLRDLRGFVRSSWSFRWAWDPGGDTKAASNPPMSTHHPLPLLPRRQCLSSFLTPSPVDPSLSMFLLPCILSAHILFRSTIVRRTFQTPRLRTHCFTEAPAKGAPPPKKKKKQPDLEQARMVATINVPDWPNLGRVHERLWTKRPVAQEEPGKTCYKRCLEECAVDTTAP